MNRYLLGILALACIVATMTTATHIPIEGEAEFFEANSQLNKKRSLRALNMHHKGKKAPSSAKRSKHRFPLAVIFDSMTTPAPTRSATKRLPLATRRPFPTKYRTTPSPTIRLPLATGRPFPTKYRTTPSPTIRLPLATRRPFPTKYRTTPSPTAERLPLATRKPTPSPTSPQEILNVPYCLAVDKKVYDCGDPITVSFDVSERENPEPARIRDFIGIFPHYVSSYDVPEIWQWTCSPPPFVPRQCSNGPQYSGTVVFNGLPEYNSESSAWPVSANYDPLEREVSRFFKVVLLRGDGTPYCVSKRFQILENSLPGCSIRVSSPSG